MSWVSLSGSEGGDSGNNYKEVAKQAFASPTNLSSRLGNRAPASSKDGLSVTASVASRRIPSRINSEDEAEAFHQMFNSTAVKVSKKQYSENKSNNLGEGLKALAKKASRQYYADLNSTDAEASGSLGKESFSIGSVSRRTKDLDLAHNDNSFHVIGGLIVEFFQSKLKEGNSDLRLTPQDIAQLDRLAPPRVRASFVEAVRYRFTNSPMDSTSSVHMLARQCHELGLDAEGPLNPLLVAAETEIVIPFPRGNKKSSTSSRSASSAISDSEGCESVTPSGGSSCLSYQNPGQTGHSQTKGHSGLAPSNLSPYAAQFSRPSRQCEDPPEGPISISTRLTKLGVELPFGSETGSGENVSSTGSVTAHSHASKSQKSERSAVIGTGSVRTSLTKFGIEMPRYPETPGNEGAMKTTVTNPDTMEAQMPVEANGSKGASSAQSESGASAASLSSCQKSNASSADFNGPQNEHHNERTMDSPNLSMSSKAESSIMQVTSSKDFSNSVGLAKQQLLAELREAENLMAESKTQEAAKFWRDHVLELEARLKALNGEEGSVASSFEKEPVRTELVAPEQAHPTIPSQDDEKNVVPMGEAGHYGQSGASHDDHFESMSHRSDTRHRHPHYEMEGARAPLMIDPSLEGVPMVDVVAPADLPGGYHFEAEIEGRRFLATVPAGGVQKGETFSCYMRDLEKVGSDIPVGRWRDGLFDCCSTGLCHPVIGNALFCPLVILGQIMTRVGFDFLGRPSLDNSTNGPNTLWTILCFWVFVNLALFSAYNFKWSRGMELSMADLGALAFVNVAYMLFVVYLTSATRGSLREKYYIRESRFHDLEDCCCATFCLPCALCQMARHTADYGEYEGVCCNDTGLPDSYEAHGVETTKQSSNYLV